MSLKEKLNEKSPQKNRKSLKNEKASFLGEAFLTCSHMSLNLLIGSVYDMESNPAQDKEQAPCH